MMRQPAPTRRDFLKFAGLGAASLAAARAESVFGGDSTSRPNVLVILMDDLGYGDLSSYGAMELQSPSIDRLVAGGMRFDRFYANSPVCSPTRAALLTGRFPDVVGVPGVIRTDIRDNWGNLAEQAVLLPRVLKDAGYHTALVGKWHLGLNSPNTPNERGFDHFHGFLGDMMDDYTSHRRHGNNYMRLNGDEIDPEGHATDLFTRWAIDYLRERAGKSTRQSRGEGILPSDLGQNVRDFEASGNHGQDARETQGRDALATRQPFFLYLAYNAPHTPIQPPQEWLDRVRRRESGIDDRRAKLVALIEHLDDRIGKVLDALEETGLADNTLVIFASDNGGQFSAGASNGPLRAGKGDMYEGGIRVPMCAVWPGSIKAGSRSDRVAMTMDIFPTVCEAAGLRIDHKIDGVSLLPTLLGKAQPPDDRILFWVRREGGAQYGGRAYYAARQGDFKLLQNSPHEPMKLYNLAEDPQEQHPLDGKHPMHRKLFNALQDRVNASGAIPWQRPAS
ncbi:MAG TPA: sulfatase-like hydrolase/transferase [Sedimentisphaerales bacterium]|jgi:arylsulfatase A-like enzyme|nr:sulfatase-like hydrolase/transferase [Sedimentisphaerales bacterium]HNU30769.1 sulfatase-like hydrolase/transferase [Sedimentisphaerales bacterium]